MPIESETLRIAFLDWLPLAAVYWCLAVGGLALLGGLFGLLLAMVERGPVAGISRSVGVITSGVADLFGISPRRVMALAWLAFKESIRRRVVVVFAIFILILLFAGWFLDPGSPNPGRLYLSFVLTATSYLVLLLALFLSAFSLPAEIRSRTLHTVVTKPVRPSEIVLGRLLGFTAIGTGLLVLMGVVSYIFVVQGLSHSHAISEEDLTLVAQSSQDGKFWIKGGKTSPANDHRHGAYVDSTGNMRTAVERGHWHKMSASGDQKTYTLGSPQGMLQARVPVYGHMRFRDRDGIDTQEGLNVGDEWFYRGYIPGLTPAALVWRFQNVDPDDYPEELPLEMSIGVFRTHKGNMEKGILGSISVRNPKNGLTVEVEIFESKEFTIRRMAIPRKITKYSNVGMVSRKIETPEGVVSEPPQSEVNPTLAEKREFDLFEDLVSDGEVEIWLHCLEPGQYFGAAQPDLYLCAADVPFGINFIKGYMGIWLQMVLVIGFGVMFSTFLSGSVAMIATLGTLVGGFFVEFMGSLAKGQVYGGGPLEALIRLLKQMNLMTDLNLGYGDKFVEMIDSVFEGGLWAVSSVLPAFGQFSYSQHLAYGFNVPGELLLRHMVMAIAYLLPLFVVGYFFLKTREVAR